MENGDVIRDWQNDNNTEAQNSTIDKRTMKMSRNRIETGTNYTVEDILR